MGLGRAILAEEDAEIEVRFLVVGVETDSLSIGLRRFQDLALPGQHESQQGEAQRKFFYRARPLEIAFRSREVATMNG